jgi:methyl-accepting chemotaxis protein
VKTDEDKQLLKDFDEHWGNYLGQHVQFVSFSRQDKKKEANEALGQDAWTEYSKITDILNSLKDRTTSRADEASRKVESISRASSGLIWIASLVAVGIGVAASLLISRNVMDRVGRAVKSLVEIAAQVTAASQQMASMSQQSASGAAEQAAALQQATASIHELSQMVNRNVENAEKSKDVSKTSHSSADEGRGVVEQMIQEMGEVSTTNSAMLSQIEENNRKISEITQVINEIGNRTKVINEIVFQTKLLSFNASVEAARAGEHGKGFAVVAEEVGNLARMSGQASHDISQLLRESVERVETIVAGSRSGLESLAAQSKSRIERGQSIAGECGEVLNQIVNHAGEVSSRVEDIAQASKEQADGLRSITSATQQLDRATQEAAKAAEEASTSAHQLADYADQMSRTLADVTEAVFGQKINQRTGEVIAFPRAEQPKRDSTAA